MKLWARFSNACLFPRFVHAHGLMDTYVAICDKIIPTEGQENWTLYNLCYINFHVIMMYVTAVEDLIVKVHSVLGFFNIEP